MQFPAVLQYSPGWQSAAAAHAPSSTQTCAALQNVPGPQSVLDRHEPKVAPLPPLPLEPASPPTPPEPLSPLLPPALSPAPPQPLASASPARLSPAQRAARSCQLRTRRSPDPTFTIGSSVLKLATERTPDDATRPTLSDRVSALPAAPGPQPSARTFDLAAHLHFRQIARMSVITILGAGMMGSAWCVPLLDAGHQVRLVGTHLDGEIIDSLRQTGAHPKLGLELPAQLAVFPISELAVALDAAQVIGLGVSSQGVRWAAEALAPHFSARASAGAQPWPVMSISKGLEWTGAELRVLPDVFSEALNAALSAGGSAPLELSPVAVAGPCIAGELARRVETCVVMTGRDPQTTRGLAALVRTPYYHAFPSDDVLGVEVCAALKNAYAMGISFAAGIHESRAGAPGSVAMHNHESAVFAQAVLEMMTIVELLGGDPKTAAGMAGVGDLDVTCNGGRTGRFGRLLGAGLSRDQAVQAMQGATLECLDIIQVMHQAVTAFEGAGRLPHGNLPLLRHMTEVVQDGAAVNVPFTRFFGGLEPQPAREHS